MKIWKALVVLCALALASPALADQIHTATVATGTTDVQVVSGGTAATRGLMFCGFSVRETVGSAAATIDFYNGTSAAGTLLATTYLATSTSANVGPAEASSCVPAPSGIWIDRGGTGSAVVVVYYRTRPN